MNARRVITALVAATLLVTPVGCARRGRLAPPAPASGAAAAPADPAVSEQDTTGQAPAEQAPAPKTSSAQASPSSGGMTAADSAALDAELTQIDRELGSLSMPSDSDFSDAESALR